MQSSIFWVNSPSQEMGTIVTGIKNTSGCMAGLTLALVCVAAAGLLVVIQGEEWVRRDQRLSKGLIKSRIKQVPYKVSVGSSCFLAVPPRFCLVLDPRGRLGGKVEGACEKVHGRLYWVNVPNSSGADSWPAMFYSFLTNNCHCTSL